MVDPQLYIINKILGDGRFKAFTRCQVKWQVVNGERKVVEVLDHLGGESVKSPHVYCR